MGTAHPPRHLSRSTMTAADDLLGWEDIAVTAPLKRLGWFAALWIAGVVTVMALAYGVRWFLGL